jgi:hypothetical protein
MARDALDVVCPVRLRRDIGGWDHELVPLPPTSIAQTFTRSGGSTAGAQETSSLWIWPPSLLLASRTGSATRGKRGTSASEAPVCNTCLRFIVRRVYPVQARQGKRFELCILAYPWLARTMGQFSSYLGRHFA